MGESYELKNRYLHVAWKESAYSDEKQPIKQPIEHIGENRLSEILETKTVSSRTKANITRLIRQVFLIAGGQLRSCSILCFKKF